MNAVERTQREYLLQQGLDYTPENVRVWGLNEADLHVLYEDEERWLVLHTEEGVGATPRLVVNAVYKDDDTRMVSVEV